MLTTKTLSLDSSESLQNRFDSGRRLFGRLISTWMTDNDWSHPVMIKLATACLQLPDGRGWLHSSQIAGLRHANLGAPGPRCFVGLERLNYYLHRYREHGLLIPGTKSSNDYANPAVITEDDQPPELGWWVEVFCGYRIPKDIDLQVMRFSDASAAKFSQAWGRLIRKLIAANGKDVISDLNSIIEDHYHVKGLSRIKKVSAVIYNKAFWTAAELTVELPSITAFTSELGGPASEEDLFASLEI